MSDVLDDFREDDNPGDADDAPGLVYGSVDEFVREYLRHMYTRPVGPGNARHRWAADWWRYPEAVARIESLWRAWEHLRQDPRDRFEHLVGRARRPPHGHSAEP